MKMESKILSVAGMLLSGGALLSPSITLAQASGGNRTRTTNSTSVSNAVARLMAFDKNKDGKLTREEVTDERLRSLFERADANKDGVVTKAELTSFFEH